VAAVLDSLPISNGYIADWRCEERDGERGTKMNRRMHLFARVAIYAGGLVCAIVSTASAQTTVSTMPSGNDAVVQQTAQGLHAPSNFTYTRLYCTPDGNSHWKSESVELPSVNFAPPAAPIHIGSKIPASSTFFGGFEPGWGAQDVTTRLYHPAPAVQFVVVLDGVFTLTATDGETRRFSPGDVFRVEDISPCKGHITVVGEKPGFLMFVR
jgi:hypothetical protein